jgi:hypothetical protein
MILVGAALSHAQDTKEINTVYGFAALASAGKGFDCAPMLNFYRKAPQVYHASMWQTFGKRRACWKKIFSLNKKVHFQVYISNEVCRKKGNCASYEVLPDLSVKELNLRLEKNDKAVLRFYKVKSEFIRNKLNLWKKAEDKIYLSPGLESLFTRLALKNLVSALEKGGWDRNEIIHNPSEVSNFRDAGDAGRLEWHNSNHTSGMRYERIAIEPKKFNFTFDGADPDFCNGGRTGLSDRISEANLRRTADFYRNRARFVGFWCSNWQGLSGDSGSAPDPRNRKFVVDHRDFERFRLIARY